MKKSIRIILCLALMVVAMCSTMVISYAETTLPDTVTVSIADGAYTASAASNAILAATKEMFQTKYGLSVKTVEFQYGITDVSMDFNTPATVRYYTGTDTVEAHAFTYNVYVTKPSDIQFTKTIEDIESNNSWNKDASSLLKYVNSDISITVTFGHKTADIQLGNYHNVAEKFTWADCDKEWVADGATYTFTQYVDGFTLQRKLTVTTHDRTRLAPTVTLDYNTLTFTGLDKEVVWSIDQTKWASCSENMAVAETMMGNKVYFKYAETEDYDESPTVYVNVPPRAETPYSKPTLEATSRTVTVTNCDAFTEAEFSIDGTNWVKTTNTYLTFRDLTPKTSYTVHVRTYAIRGQRLVSKEVTNSITTNTPTITNVQVTWETSARGANLWDITYDTIITAATNCSGTTVTGSLAENNFYRLTDLYSDAYKNYRRIYSNMTIYSYKEDTRYVTDTASVTFPLKSLQEFIDNGDLKITVFTDYGSAELSNSALSNCIYKSKTNTMNISIKEIDDDNKPYGTAYQWLRTKIEYDRPVYYLTSTYGSYKVPVKWSIPYVIKYNETLGNIIVYSVDSSGNKENLYATYNSATGRLEFETSFNGYIVITRDGVGNSIPFTDVEETDWFYDSVLYCYNHSIFNGTSYFTFSPKSDITRAQIYCLLARIYGADTTALTSNPYFDDVKSTDWFATGAQWAYQNKLVTDKEFNGSAYMTRAEIAEVLLKFMEACGYDTTVDSSTELPYSDVVKPNGNLKNALLFLREQGIMVGTSKTTFNPDGHVSRCEMATILKRVNSMLDIE